MEKKTKEVAGVTFTGDITVMGDMFNIHDNQNVNITNPVKESVSKEPECIIKKEDHSNRRDEELFHFVHPSIHGEEEWKIHEEVKHLVARQGIQEICQYLLQMRKDNKVLLPLSPSTAYEELIRMGMPNGGGFNENTFRKYYSNK